MPERRSRLMLFDLHCSRFACARRINRRASEGGELLCIQVCRCHDSETVLRPLRPIGADFPRDLTSKRNEEKLQVLDRKKKCAVHECRAKNTNLAGRKVDQLKPLIKFTVLHEGRGRNSELKIYAPASNTYINFIFSWSTKSYLIIF